MACELNILDIPLSASAPNPTDVVIFTLADGTSVIRTWSAIMSGSVPDDVEVQVTASGGTLNNGATGITLAQFIGKRARLIRNNVPQHVARGEFTFNTTTGAFTFPIVTTGEVLLFMAY